MKICKDEIIDYLLKNSSDEPELLQELRRETNLKCINSIMISGELQGRLLSLISKIKKPNYILEIGTFTGYSALCLAEGLKKGGEIHTIDKNEELLQIQNKYFQKSGYIDNIFQYTTDASIILEKMKKKFDIIFLMLWSKSLFVFPDIARSTPDRMPPLRPVENYIFRFCFDIS